jgi:hypothetical protein
VQRLRTKLVATTGESFLVQPLGLVQIIKAQRDFGFEELSVASLQLRTGSKEVLRDSEAPTELPEKLQRGDAVPGFDP